MNVLGRLLPWSLRATAAKGKEFNHDYKRSETAEETDEKASEG